MTRKIDRIKLSSLLLGGYDEVLDVRSPSEFSEDHLGGAVNLPVLDDEERTRVGTIYKHESAFEARRIGAALVARNIARHLDGHFASKGRDYRPLLYCWRGGMRSGSLATVLSEVGWRPAVLDGGYRSYRAAVVSTIESKSAELDFVVLNGYTGAGKTAVLRALDAMGEQVLDLEADASHKGSVFGGDLAAPQPAQKRFESLLYERLSRFEAGRPVFIEAESAKIGRLNLPNPLWQRMKLAPVVELVSPREARAAYLTQDYADWLSAPARVLQAIERLKGYHSDATLAAWKALAETGGWEDLAYALLEEHYDRRYARSAGAGFQPPSLSLTLVAHDDEAIRRLAAELRERAPALSPAIAR